MYIPNKNFKSSIEEIDMGKYLEFTTNKNAIKWPNYSVLCCQNDDFVCSNKNRQNLRFDRRGVDKTLSSIELTFNCMSHFVGCFV